MPFIVSWHRSHRLSDSLESPVFCGDWRGNGTIFDILSCHMLQAFLLLPYLCDQFQVELPGRPHTACQTQPEAFSKSVTPSDILYELPAFHSQLVTCAVRNLAPPIDLNTQQIFQVESAYEECSTIPQRHTGPAQVSFSCVYAVQSGAVRAGSAVWMPETCCSPITGRIAAAFYRGQ